MSSADSIISLTAGELVLVCSRYDLGKIRRVRPLRAGSGKSPKVVLETDLGSYLLKRRSPGASSDPHHVAATHEMVLHLERAGLPIPQLVGTRGDNNSMLQTARAIYEVYRFVPGRPYARTVDDALAAGALLARIHQELASVRLSWPLSEYVPHCGGQITQRLRALPDRLSRSDLEGVCRALAERFERARVELEQLGWARMPTQLTHCDWHPGNILFSKTATGPTLSGEDPRLRVAAVLDFESAQMAPVVLDAAMGSLYFALSRKSAGSGASKRLALNPDLFGAFWRGYLLRGRGGGAGGTGGAGGAGGAGGVKAVEGYAVPWLMIEGLIAEVAAVLSVSTTFGGEDARIILELVERGCAGLEHARAALVSLAISS